MQDKLKILYISPHLSTGGLPQYLWKKIEVFNDVGEIYCVEYDYLGDAYVVQRNRIKELLGDRFIPIFSDGTLLYETIEKINPDVIHFEEFCESFVPDEILLKIFSKDRKYKIVESCHSSVTEVSSKIYKPDLFVMVSKWNDEKFKTLGIPSIILEYPIEELKPEKSKCMEFLGFNPEYKHIVNVGLFTPGKNQAEIFEYAREILNMNLEIPIIFHFVGNLADNFRDYWKPLVSDVPSNCHIWGERSDVDLFYQASDLFLFTSNFELNPLSIKESLSWNLPTVIKKLPTYLDMYDNMKNVHYLSSDKAFNVSLILKLLNV